MLWKSALRVWKGTPLFHSLSDGNYLRCLCWGESWEGRHLTPRFQTSITWASQHHGEQHSCDYFSTYPMLSQEPWALLRISSGHANASAKVEIQCTHENQQREGGSLLLCIKDSGYQALPWHTETHCPKMGRQTQSCAETNRKENKESSGLAARNKVMAAPLETCRTKELHFTLLCEISHYWSEHLCSDQTNHKCTHEFLNCSVMLLIPKD